MEYVRSLGFPVSYEDSVRAEHWEHFYFASSLEIQKDSKTFTDDRTGFWINFARRRLVALGLKSGEAADLAPKLSAYMDEAYKPQVHVPPDAYELLATLKEKGYVLGVVSNRETPYQEELQALKLDSFFKFSLAGGEVNSFKPDRAIFEHALKMAGTSAPESIYIGDNYFADVLGSHRAGLTPVLYDPISLFPDTEHTAIRSFAELPNLLK